MFIHHKRVFLIGNARQKYYDNVVKQFITYLLILATGLLFSCTADESPENTIPKGEDTTFNLKLSTSSVQPLTKAIDAKGNYQYATADELQVGNIVVALFWLDDNGIPGELIECIETTPNETTVDIDNDSKNVLAWEIEGLPAKTGKIRVLAVANPNGNESTGKNDYTDKNTFSTYTDFENAIEKAVFSPSFEAKNLVKAGYIDYIFKANSNNEVIVPMKQLAARIDLNLVVDMSSSMTYQEFKYDSAMLEAIKLIDRSEVQKNKYDKNNPYETKIGNTGISIYSWNDKEVADKDIKGKPFYNPFTKKIEHAYTPNKDVKIAAIDNITLEVITHYETYGLKLNRLTINNIQTQTDLLLTKINTQPLNPLNDNVWGAEQIVAADTFKLTFYTYEKGFYETDLSEALNIDFDCTLLKGTSILTQMYEDVLVHALWLCGDPTKDKDYGKQLSGWNSYYKDDQFVPLIPGGTEISGEPDNEFKEDESQQGKPHKFNIIINPEKSASGTNLSQKGVIHGNLYELTVNVTDKKAPTKSGDSTPSAFNTANLQISNETEIISW